PQKVYDELVKLGLIKKDAVDHEGPGNDLSIDIIPIFPALLEHGQEERIVKAMREGKVTTRLAFSKEYMVPFLEGEEQAPWATARLESNHPLGAASDFVKRFPIKWGNDNTFGACADIIHIDSGVNFHHVEFEDVGSTPEVPKFRVSQDGRNAIAFVKKDEMKKFGVGDVYGHGTKTGSLIIGKTMGLARHAHMRVVKVGNNKLARGSDIIKGLDWAGKEHLFKVKSGNPRPTFINLSMGTEGVCDLTNAAARKVVESGAFLIVAGGNDAKDASAHSPGGIEEVVTVGASTITDEIWKGETPGVGSAHGRLIDVFAPGHKVAAASHTDVRAYTFDAPGSGTSLATGLVTGMSAYLYCHPAKPLGNVTPKTLGAVLRKLSVESQPPNGKMKGPLPADTTDIIAHIPEPFRQH
ncbi:hypothetical protein CVT24_003186, partial [Panaeolus cyanescens]